MSDQKWEKLFELLSEAMRDGTSGSWKERAEQFNDKAKENGFGEIEELGSWLQYINEGG